MNIEGASQSIAGKHFNQFFKPCDEVTGQSFSFLLFCHQVSGLENFARELNPVNGHIVR